ncbi:MAG: Sau3AI family type II restriction endonuclease [Methanolobus sp.]|nr:Sau3AI family type II restriction endonuclease [Methanolobus sp.]
MLEFQYEMPYEIYSSKDIERYAKKLIGKRFIDIQVPENEDTKALGSPGNKGHLGQYLERFYFLYEPNSSKAPDFLEAGVELKVSPLKRLKNNQLRAKERIVLNIIDFTTIVEEKWEESSFLHKNGLLLLVFYLHEEGKERLDNVIRMVTLWDYGEKDLEIIKQDWHKIVNKIREGKAHELSERDTLYLGACPKGVNCGSTREQPFSDELAMQRAFSLKQSYVNSIISRIEDTEPAIATLDDFDTGKTFEDIIREKMSKYQGMDVQTIHAKVGYGLNPRSKNYYASLAARMLGLKKNKIEEFEKGDVILKTIRLRRDGMPKESMSFPYFDYQKIVDEAWESSTFLNQLDRRFFFMVFQYDGQDKLCFKKGMFWGMPYEDMQEAMSVWEETVKRIKEGRATDLPRIRDNHVCHVRPHAQSSKDTCETPHGEHVVKKCFWLNASYLKEQIERS